MGLVKGCLATALIAFWSSVVFAETEAATASNKTMHPVKPLVSTKASTKTTKKIANLNTHRAKHKIASKSSPSNVSPTIQPAAIKPEAATQEQMTSAPTKPTNKLAALTSQVILPGVKGSASAIAPASAPSKNVIYESDSSAVAAAKKRDPEASTPTVADDAPIMPGHQVLAGDAKAHDFYIVEPENVQKVQKLIAAQQQAALDKFYAEHPKMVIEVEAKKPEDMKKLLEDQRKSPVVASEAVPVLSKTLQPVIQTPPEKTALPQPSILSGKENMALADSEDDDEDDDDEMDEETNSPNGKLNNQDATPVPHIPIASNLQVTTPTPSTQLDQLTPAKLPLTKQRVVNQQSMNQQAKIVKPIHPPTVNNVSTSVSASLKRPSRPSSSLQHIPSAIETAFQQSKNKEIDTEMLADAASSQHSGHLLASQEDGPSLETVLKQAKHQPLQLASSEQAATPATIKTDTKPHHAVKKVKTSKALTTNKKVSSKKIVANTHSLNKPKVKKVAVKEAKQSKTKKVVSKTTKQPSTKKVAANKQMKFESKPFIPSKPPKQSVATKESKHPKQSVAANAKESKHLKLGEAVDYSTYLKANGKHVTGKTKLSSKPIGTTAASHSSGTKSIHSSHTKQHRHAQHQLAASKNPVSSN